MHLRGVAVVLVLAGLGAVFLFLGSKTDGSLLTSAGFCLLGAAAIYIGVETIITRRIVARSHHDRRVNETYVGVAAVAQGVQIVLLGLFLAVIAVLVHLDLGAPLVRHFVRRPGAVLILAGVAVLTNAVIAGVGYVEQRKASGFAYVVDLLVSRFLAGTVLFVVGLAALGLGLLEVFSPGLFDAWGGGYLEALYGIR